MPQQASSTLSVPEWPRQECCGSSADTPMLNTNTSNQIDRPQGSGAATSDELPTAPSFSKLDQDASLYNQMSLFTQSVLSPYLWPNGSPQPRIHHESFAHLALLCTIAAAVWGDREVSAQAELLRSQAHEHLYEVLRAGLAATPSGLQTILDLCCIETIAGNSGQARLHLKMLRDLVSQIAGILCVDGGLREDLISCDCYFALKCETRPLFPAKDWAIAKLHDAWVSKLQASDPVSPHDKGSSPLLLQISQDLRLVFEALRELFMAHSTLVRGRLHQAERLAEWCRWRKLYCISRLADHYVNASLYAHQYDSPQVEKATALAAALLTNMALGSPEPVSLALTLLKRLQLLLRVESSATQQHGQPLLRLWAVYVGSLAESLHSGERSYGSEYWFRIELVKSSRACQLQVPADLNGLLRQVLFSEELQSEVDHDAPRRTFDLVPGLYTSCDISWRLPAAAEHFRN